MDILNPQKILDAAFVGRTIAKQPGVPENDWGTVIRGLYRDECGDWIVSAGGPSPFIMRDEIGLEPKTT